MAPTGRKRSAGTFASEREARHAARRAESSVESGAWYDRTAGKITFRGYVEETWWPSRHLELSTKQGYRSNLDKHFLPFFGDLPMAKILPSTVQGWVTLAVADGLSALIRIPDLHTLTASTLPAAGQDLGAHLAPGPAERVELATAEDISLRERTYSDGSSPAAALDTGLGHPGIVDACEPAGNTSSRICGQQI